MGLGGVDRREYYYLGALLSPPKKYLKTRLSTTLKEGQGGQGGQEGPGIIAEDSI
jgi:hypothetical protein